MNKRVSVALVTNDELEVGKFRKALSGIKPSIQGNTYTVWKFWNPDFGYTLFSNGALMFSGLQQHGQDIVQESASIFSLSIDRWSAVEPQPCDIHVMEVRLKHKVWLNPPINLTN